MTMIYRINAGTIPSDHWIQDMEIGGGRIVGEVCHFIDYLTFINGSLPVKVSANALPDPNNLNDAVNILIEFENGSTGVIGYYSNGSKKLPKEHVEIFSSGTSVVLRDFKSLKIYGKGKTISKKLLNQNKGQKQMVESYFNSLLDKGKAPISQEEIFGVSLAAFKVLESLKNGGNQVRVK